MKKSEYLYFSAFTRITQAISSSLDLENVLDRIVRSTCEITGSKGCALMLLDAQGRNLNVKSSYGLSESYVKKGPVDVDRSISDALKGKPVVIEYACSDPRVQYPLAAKEEGIASIVSVPIVLKGGIIGVLRLYTAVPCEFSQDDLDFLSAVAHQSGLAIENAERYEQAKRESPRYP